MEQTKTSVYHKSRDHIEICPAPGWTVTVFNFNRDHSAEAVVTRNDGTETIRLLIAAPEKGKRMLIEREQHLVHGEVVHVRYADV